MPADTPDSQFDVPRAFLQQQFDASAYQLVVMTRDDFVYRQGSWDALSSRYDPRKLNIVSTDCSGHVWDGLHCSLPHKPRSLRVHGLAGGLTTWSRGLTSRRLAFSMCGSQACTGSLMSASQQWGTWIAGPIQLGIDSQSSSNKISTQLHGTAVIAVRQHTKS